MGKSTFNKIIVIHLCSTLASIDRIKSFFHQGNPYHIILRIPQLSVILDLPFIIWLQKYARSDWLLIGQDFLVMRGHY